ncbi:hypothetical protein D8796_08335 [Streptococcus cristatus]|uniref:Uncharacterized protein n=1 Tax=Streptococcus cristatus TaxID=45634 RepID=A0A3R9LCV3_STRCR|nr:hypothetical protein [Streptococcus cristatus]RSJ78123.1 hypothetical protein D8795_09165 [Streptococcus cristatus]RSJ78725.1 hypothetical protein D8796_08335 [Streptococcus cristatus]RSJ84245.1 hypothetical protein D8793_10150 [Streptococcus cristatus]RSJ85094.1 hypothetical protein D8794_07830 [Streptococcus cristatus]
MEFSKDDLEIILWEFIAHQLEELSVFKALSENLPYLNREKLDMVDSSEIHDSDGLTIVDLQQNDRELFIRFEMDVQLMGWTSASNDYAAYIQATLVGSCQVDLKAELAFSDKNVNSLTKAQLLEYGEKLISDLEFHYRDVEGSEHYG